MAAELLHRGVDVIVTSGTPAIMAATIVFILSTDPVEAGLVSKPHPRSDDMTFFVLQYHRWFITD